MRPSQINFLKAGWASQAANIKSPLGSQILARAQRGADKAAAFDKYFPSPADPYPKAWEGQDKDKYFKDRFSHIHADQKKKRDAQLRKTKGKPPVSAYKAARSFAKNKQRRAEKRGEVFEPNKKSDLQKEEQKPDYKLQLRNPSLQYVYGMQTVKAALMNPQRNISRMFTQAVEGEANSEVVKLAEDRSIEIIYSVPKIVLNEICKNGVHNGYIVETRPLVTENATFLGEFESEKQQFPVHLEDGYLSPVELHAPHKKRFPLGLFLDRITDVHNFGAILRSAYFLGVDFVAYHSANAASLNSVLAKTASGALDHMHLYNVQFPEKFLQQSRQKSWRIVSSTLQPLNKEKTILPSQLNELLSSGPCLLVLGSESKGVRKALSDRSDFEVTLDGSQDKTKVDSLNVSVAAAIMLSKFFGDSAFDV